MDFLILLKIWVKILVKNKTKWCYIFYQPVKNDLMTYENIRKIATGQGDDYRTGCLLDYPYFKNCYKIITIDLSIQQAFDADSKAIQQINLTAKLDKDGNRTMFFIIEEAKEAILNFSQGTVKVLWMSLYNLTRVAKVSHCKLFDRTACSTIYFALT